MDFNAGAHLESAGDDIPHVHFALSVAIEGSNI